MTFLRTLRSALTACWARCIRVFDVENCLVGTGLILLAIGCHQIYPPLGYVVPGGVLVLIGCLAPILRFLAGRRASVAEPTRGHKWAS